MTLSIIIAALFTFIVSEQDPVLKYEFLEYSLCISARGGHSGTEGGGGGAPSLRVSRKKGSFLRPPHVRDFVKEGYFFVPGYEVWGSKSPYNPRNIRGSDAG